jgi:hypothetical protein
MNIQHLIAIVERRIVYLSQVRSSAEALGDIERVAAIDAEVNETNATLVKLRTLL